MKLLLDTHIAVWLITNDPKLSARARSMIVDEASSVHVSLVTMWEVAVKRSLSGSRTDWLNVTPAGLMSDFQASDVAILGIAPEHVFGVEDLPWHHRDPFDRLLVAQAIHEPMRLLTVDAMLAHYSDIVVVI